MALRPRVLRQRVGRRRELPGRNPGRARAGPAGGDGPQGFSSRARLFGASRRSQAAATSTCCRYRPSYGPGGPQPAALPVGPGEAPCAEKAPRVVLTSSTRLTAREGAARGSEGQGKEAVVLGQGPRRRRRSSRSCSRSASPRWSSSTRRFRRAARQARIRTRALEDGSRVRGGSAPELGGVETLHMPRRSVRCVCARPSQRPSSS